MFSARKPSFSFITSSPSTFDIADHRHKIHVPGVKFQIRFFWPAFFNEFTASQVKHVTTPFLSKLSYCLQAFLFIVSDHVCFAFSLSKSSSFTTAYNTLVCCPMYGYFLENQKTHAMNRRTASTSRTGHPSSSFLVDKSLCIKTKFASLVYHVSQEPNGLLENTFHSTRRANWR